MDLEGLHPSPHPPPALGGPHGGGLSGTDSPLKRPHNLSLAVANNVPGPGH